MLKIFFLETLFLCINECLIFEEKKKVFQTVMLANVHFIELTRLFRRHIPKLNPQVHESFVGYVFGQYQAQIEVPFCYLYLLLNGQKLSRVPAHQNQKPFLN